MYKNLVISISFFLLVLSPITYAESESYTLTNYQTELLSKNCYKAQSVLSRVHYNDTLSRVHLAQEYETLSNKFMTPMNNRVSLSRLDGVALTKTTVDFNVKLDEFRNLYQQYDNKLTKLMGTKCVDQPQIFYNLLVDTQQARSLVKGKVNELSELTVLYKKQVNDIKTIVIQQG